MPDIPRGTGDDLTLFLVAVGLFSFGRLEVMDDILDTMRDYGPNAITELTYTPSWFLPLPQELDPLARDAVAGSWTPALIEAVRLWVKNNKDRLVWSEEQGRYLLVQ